MPRFDTVEEALKLASSNRIAELETHQTIDVEKLTLAGLLDRWLEATHGEMRVATRNSYSGIRRLHVDPALGKVLACELTRIQLSACYSAKLRGNGHKPTPRRRWPTTTR